MNGQSYEEMLSHRSTIALTKKTITLAPKRTVAGLGEAHWIYIYIYISSEIGGAQPGNRFVSFVRAYARSGSEVGMEKIELYARRFPFSPLDQNGISFEFSMVPVSPGEI